MHSSTAFTDTGSDQILQLAYGTWKLLFTTPIAVLDDPNSQSLDGHYLN